MIAAALMTVGAEAREEAQTAGLSCPVAAATTKQVAVSGSGSGIGGDAREQVAEWNAWTTNRCEANYAAVIDGGGGVIGEAKANDVVCAYYDSASFSDAEQRLSAQKMCQSGKQTRSTLGGAHACYDIGDCLVEFMNVTPVVSADSKGSSEWEFRLGDLAATDRVIKSSSDPVRVGELVVSSQVSTLYVQAVSMAV